MAIIVEFHVERADKNRYELSVYRRGDSTPLARSSFECDLSSMTPFELRRLEPHEKDAHGRLQRLAEFGRALHGKLFSPEVQEVWRQHHKESDFLVLCLRIVPEAEGLEALPWETLHDGEGFIAAGSKTGLSWLPLDVALHDELPAVPAPLRMLALISNPLDLAETERLQVEREQEILVQAVNTPGGQGELHVDFEDEAKLPIVKSSLEGGYQVFHYSGCGIPPEDGGGLLLEDAEDKKRPVAVNKVLQVLEKGRKDLRLAVISGCQTARTSHTAGFQDLGRALLRRRIPSVIAMQFSITDNAGLLLVEHLYARLTEGKTVEQAVSAARRALLHSDQDYIKGDALAPVLPASHSNPLELTMADADRAHDMRKSLSNLPLGIIFDLRRD